MILHVSMLQQPEEIAAIVKQYAAGTSRQAVEDISAAITKPIGVKQLLMVLEMARSEGADHIDPMMFTECLHTGGF